MWAAGMRRSRAARTWAICACVSAGRFGQGRGGCAGVVMNAGDATRRGSGRVVAIANHLLGGGGGGGGEGRGGEGGGGEGGGGEGGEGGGQGGGGGERRGQMARDAGQVRSPGR